MESDFRKEVELMQKVMYPAYLIIIIAANAYYRTTATLFIAVAIVLSWVLKNRRMKKHARELDERLAFIYYRAMSVGFLFLILVAFWYYTKEMALVGSISARTYSELLGGLIAYLSALFILKRKY